VGRRWKVLENERTKPHEEADKYREHKLSNFNNTYALSVLQDLTNVRTDFHGIHHHA
jgi:hypothetical protein